MNMAVDNVEIPLKCHLELCFKLLKQYSWLLDSYVLDFFTERYWEKLPKCWKENLERIPIEDFHKILSFHTNNHIICPLSLLCLRVLVQYLTIPRHMKGTENSSFIEDIEKNKVDISKISYFRVNVVSPLVFKHPKLWNHFLKHVKPKKRYEIFKMAEMTAQIAHNLNVAYVVDVGSGLGHLSRVLAYGFNLNVCSIETQVELTKQAQKLDSEFEATASKYLNDVELKKLKSQKPFHMNQTITLNLDVNNFIKVLKNVFLINDDNFKFGIIGLHPCGDLAAILLKLYSTCSESRFINLVGCCYHKLSTACDTTQVTQNFSFPLATFCSEKSIDVSYEARALACHAIEAYCNRLKSKDYGHLKVHCYRAALEKLIDKNWPRLRKSGLNNVKAGPDLDFSLYCKLALKKMGLSVPSEDLNSTETLENLSQWKNVVKYYSLRLLLAPIVETVILLDRKMFLLEKGIPVKIVTAFDPIISPRNQLLISEKPS